MLPAMFQLIWPSCFRGDLKKLAIQKQELPVEGHVWKGIITKCALFREDLPLMLPTKLKFIATTGKYCF
jgi:hypothetical protein